MALWDLSIEELRGLASEKNISPYYEDDGVRKPLSSEDLRNMLTRLALREKGLALYSYRDLEAGCSPSARQHTFWSDKDASTWDSCTHLPNYAQVGLFSKLAVGYDVVLWTYHPSIDGLPPAPANNLTIADASLLWPRKDAWKHVALQWWRIQHVSDYIRFLAISRHHSDEGIIEACSEDNPLVHQLPIAEGAWFADLDCVEFDLATRLPSRSLHCFNCMTASISSHFYPAKQAKVKFLRVPGEPAWLAVPFYFPRGSPVLQRIIERFHCFIGSDRLYRDYNAIMRLVKSELQDASLHLDILRPHVYNGVPHTQQHRSMFSGNSSMATNFSTILKAAMGFNQYWSSTKHNDRPKEKALARGCFMEKMLQEIGLGDFITGGYLPVSFFRGRVVLRSELGVVPTLRMNVKGRPKMKAFLAPQWLSILIDAKAWPRGKKFLDPMSWLALVRCCTGFLSGKVEFVKPWFQLLTKVLSTCRSSV
jgi:hypothetical protein